MVLLRCCRRDPARSDIIWRMAMCGIGFGFFQAPNMKAVMGSAPPHRSGSASGIVATARPGRRVARRCRGVLYAGRANGATVALALGAGFAALGSVMSFPRLAVK